MRSLLQQAARRLPSLLTYGVMVYCIGSIALAADTPASVQARSLPKRWVTIELQNSSAQGVVQTGRAVELAVALGGVPAGSDPVVALFESTLFESQQTYLTRDSTPMVWRGTATLEPHPASRTSVHPKSVRIKVTLARERNQKLDRILTRVVHITLGRPDPQPEGQDTPVPLVEDKAESEMDTDEIKADVEPVANALIVEEDLLPLPTPKEGKPYWEQVSQMISRSWSRHVRSARHVPTSETVRVRFKLFPSGRAQLIEIEKGSGARVIDEAGIQAVVQAQPFPPLPTELGTEAVDVHVRMRTGARTGVRDVQSVTGQSQEKRASGSIQQK